VTAQGCSFGLHIQVRAAKAIPTEKAQVGLREPTAFQAPTFSIKIDSSSLVVRQQHPNPGGADEQMGGRGNVMIQAVLTRQALEGPVHDLVRSRPIAPTAGKVETNLGQEEPQDDRDHGGGQVLGKSDQDVNPGEDRNQPPQGGVLADLRVAADQAFVTDDSHSASISRSLRWRS
jgi:hypothetical protein